MLNIVHLKLKTVINIYIFCWELKQAQPGRRDVSWEMFHVEIGDSRNQEKEWKKIYFAPKFDRIDHLMKYGSKGLGL